MKEQLLSIDDFNMPKTIQGIETDVAMLIRLILLDPGTIQSHPDMGIGLVSKWRYSDKDDLSKLEDEIQKQVTTYLPHLVSTGILVRYQGRCIVIDIITQYYTVILKTDEEVRTVYIKDILAS